MSFPGVRTDTVDRRITCIPAGACLQARETRYDGGMGIARPGEAWEPKHLESSEVMDEGELDLPPEEEDLQEEREVVF